ncbi:hypothetical protein [Roseibium sp. SCP14]|uniref:hypothetical protein n=1 Tax=Roseibium sp. SCP14 TaxID=3141375 RepID=UPI0033371AF4
MTHLFSKRVGRASSFTNFGSWPKSGSTQEKSAWRDLREMPFQLLILLAVSIVHFSGVASAQSLSTNPANFRGMTCQQLWYVEQEILAEGRVCLKTERARRAFSRAERCISADESILPRKARDYLGQLRQTARDKGCSGF